MTDPLLRLSAAPPAVTSCPSSALPKCASSTRISTNDESDGGFMLSASSSKATRLWGALALVTLPLTVLLAVVVATETPELAADFMDHGDHRYHGDYSPLIRKVQYATAKYKNINVPLYKEKGWAIATPCVSGPDHGAMGIHVVQGSRIADGVLDPTLPEALIYEPLPNGAL